MFWLMLMRGKMLMSRGQLFCRQHTASVPGVSVCLCRLLLVIYILPSLVAAFNGGPLFNCLLLSAILPYPSAI